MLVRGDRLGKTMSAYLVERIERDPLIEIRFHTQVAEVHTDEGVLSAVTVADAGGRTEALTARALFLCLGGVPRTRWAAEAGVRTDEAGYVLTWTVTEMCRQLRLISLSPCGHRRRSRLGCGRG
jgi:thioredoxin reductase (NADPH)